MIWKPDVIISSTNMSDCTSEDSIKGNPMLENVKEVKDNAIYKCPIGTFWRDRPSPEAILGILWLSQTLYPDVMRGIDIKTETMLFFSRFYHYDLTEAEFNAFNKGDFQEEKNLFYRSINNGRIRK